MMFFIILGLLILIALLFVVGPLLAVSQAKSTDDVRSSENISAYKKSLTDLETQLAEQDISEQEFAASKLELDRELLRATSDVKGQKGQRNKSWPLISAVLVVVVSIVGYWQFGNYDKLQLKAGWDNRLESRESLESFLTDYKGFLATQEKDVSGWWLVGNNYFAIGDYQQAEAAFKEALAAMNRFTEVAPADKAEVLTKIAHANFYANEILTDESKALLLEAVALEPNQTVALGLLGIGSFNNKEFLEAVKYWRKAQQLTADEQDRQAIAGGIENAISEFFAQGGSLAELEAMIGPRLQISVDNQSASEASVLFVIARPQGQRMPVAVRRVVVDSWPVTVNLSNDNAMAGQDMASFENLEIVARLSESGSATSQETDKYSEAQSFAVKNGLSQFSLVIRD